MKVVVDTSVWSLALRRRTPSTFTHVALLREVISEGRAVLLGVVRQEILSGIRFSEQFLRLKEHLRAFPDLSHDTEDFELAAQFFNTCMSRGVAGGAVDFLICSSAHRRRYKVLTSDPDFKRFAKHLPVELLESRESAS